MVRVPVDKHSVCFLDIIVNLSNCDGECAGGWPEKHGKGVNVGRKGVLEDKV